MLLALLCVAGRAQTASELPDDDVFGTPCPQNRQATAEVKVAGYMVRTYRWPDEAGCVQIFKGQELVYSETSMLFRVGADIEQTGHKSEIAPGADITGLGLPNLIVSEWTGGAHCCYLFHVFELGDRFREVAKLNGQHAGGSDFADVDHDGRYEFLTYDSTFAYWKASFAESPAPQVVLKFREGAYHVAPELMKRPAPAMDQLATAIEHVRENPRWIGSKDLPEGAVPPDLWRNMLELMYTGHAGLAWRFLHETWPADRPGKDVFVKEFCARLAESPYWPDLKATIGACPPRP